MSPAVKYWDGSAWVAIPGGGGGAGVHVDPVAPSDTEMLWIDTDEWGGVSAAGLVTSLPSSPVDGQECYYQNAAMATDGLVWHLRYRSAGGTYKWEFVGGPALLAATTVATLSMGRIGTTVYVASGSVTVPLAGEYDTEIHCETGAVPGTTGTYMTLFANGVAVPTWEGYNGLAGALNFVRRAKRTWASGDVAAIAVRTDVDHASAVWGSRHISLLPMRVG